MWPRSLKISRKTCSTKPSAVRSHSHILALMSWDEQRDAVSRRPGRLTSSSARLAPDLAKAMAIARPMPRAAPVTTASLPLLIPAVLASVRGPYGA